MVRLRQSQWFQPDMARPVISVVIPTRDRCTILRLTLEALARQEGVDGTFEVIVVDDGSTDGTLEMLRTSDFSTFDLRSVPLEHGGPARARNWGISEATAERILLLGDDMIPAPGNLNIHLAASGEPERGVLGMIEWDPEHEITDVMRFLAPEGPQFWFKGLEEGSLVPTTSLVSANLSAPRRWFLEEPFDESFTEACMEDTELGYRWWRRGWVIRFRPGAVCHHRHSYRSIEPFLERQRRAGRWTRLAVWQHPALFATLVARPVALAPLLAARTGLRFLGGRGRRDDVWDLHCRWKFVTGFVRG